MENPPNNYQDFEDELYYQRRHLVAMDDIFEEEPELQPLRLNFDDLPPQNQENNIEEDWVNINLNLDVIENEIQQPLDRQNGIDPFEEWEENHGVAVQLEIAKDPNSRWENLEENAVWTEEEELKKHEWQFPSNRMKEVEKRFFVWFHEHDVVDENREPNRNARINKLRAMYYECESCRCCERHMEDRPGFLGEQLILPFHNTRLQFNEKENRCVCRCRHIMRRVGAHLN